MRLFVQVRSPKSQLFPLSKLELHVRGTWGLFSSDWSGYFITIFGNVLPYLDICATIFANVLPYLGICATIFGHLCYHIWTSVLPYSIICATIFVTHVFFFFFRSSNRQEDFVYLRTLNEYCQTGRHSQHDQLAPGR